MKALFFTSRYQSVIPRQWEGVSARISYGRPRWKLQYELAVVPSLVPTKQMVFGGISELEYRIDYREQLLDHGTRKIEREIEAVAQGRPVVLLCFCDMSRPNAFCHRRVFADWWKQQTGQDVREL